MIEAKPPVDEYPLATSSYTRDGAEVYDPASGEVLGRADTGDWAVERAWQSAAEAREFTRKQRYGNFNANGA